MESEFGFESESVIIIINVAITGEPPTFQFILNSFGRCVFKRYSMTVAKSNLFYENFVAIRKVKGRDLVGESNEGLSR